MPSFSERNDLRRAAPISIRKDARLDLREFVLTALSHYLVGAPAILHLVFLASDQVPPTVQPQMQWIHIRTQVESVEWNHVYDIIESIYKYLLRLSDGRAQEFLELLNAFFTRNGYGYVLMGRGEVVSRGAESFETAVGTADLALSDAGLSTANSEIHAALQDLSKRPDADLTGAIQHAMAGLECAAKEVASEPKLELGKIAKRHPELFPPPLGDVIAQLYGFASENGRHLKEGGEPEFAEAELTVGIAAIVATYLARKMPA